MIKKIILFPGILLLLIAAGCSLMAGEDDSSAGSSGDSGEIGAENGAAATGTIIIDVRTEPADQAGTFSYTGVPSGTISTDNTLVVTDLEPGTYTTTQVDPAPDFDISAVSCAEDMDAPAPSQGDPGTRTAVINLDAGEIVRCTFTNTQRATAVIVVETEPEGAAGQFRFTGVPTGTIPAGGTLVTAELPPGTYTSTEADPNPLFDLTSVSCDDSGSDTASSGDPTTRSAIFNLDPGEMVTCVYVNTRRGTAIVAVDAGDSSSDTSFQFTGVPSGTIAAGGTLVAVDLTPGTYTSTAVEPPPELSFAEVVCDDYEAGASSSGDPVTRSAIFNIDAGETVTCTYIVEAGSGDPTAGGGSGDEGGTSPDSEDAPAATGTNPFSDPDSDFDNFPLPGDLPDGAGTYAVPRPGPWTAVNFAGRLSCGVMALDIPASQPEGGTLELVDGGAQVIASGISADTGVVSITLDAVPRINGRYAGTFSATQEGIPITIDYYWQLVTDEYIVGYLTSTFTQEGVTCTIYRPFELQYNG